jgi:nucleoside-diphosphate-sugar epimerase
VDIDLRGIRGRFDHEQVTLAELDIRDHGAVAELIRKADVVYHLAAAHLEVGLGEAYYRTINVDALQSMLRAAADGHVRRFVHCSTVGVYGPLSALPANESTPCNPDIAYERTKLQSEATVREAVSSLGLDAVILRPSWVYGPECPRTLKLLRAILGRRFFFVGRGDNFRHPIYISDLLDAFEIAAEISIGPGETLIIAGPRAITTRELVEKIIASAGASYRPPRLPLRPVALACRLMELAFRSIGRQPPFSTRSIKFFTESSAFSIEKARSLLGFEPAIDIDEGLARTLADAKEQGLVKI